MIYTPIAFVPGFRTTQEEYFGPITVHYAEGVIGYIPRVYYPAILCHDAEDLALRYGPQACGAIIDWCEAQGRPLSDAQRGALSDEQVLLTVGEMNTITAAIRMWQDEFAPTFVATYVEKIYQLGIDGAFD